MRRPFALLLAIASLSLAFAPAPLPRRLPGSVERSLEAHCSRNRVSRGDLVPCAVRLFPGSSVFRYPLLETSTERLRDDRHVVLVVNNKNGIILELCLVPDRQRVKCVKAILDSMRLAGKKVMNMADAQEVFRDLQRLSYWLTGEGSLDEETMDRLTVRGKYRGQEGTYGVGVFHMRLAGGDDLGMQVDRNGFVVKLLTGHVR
jgi:hypothetical protein